MASKIAAFLAQLKATKTGKAATTVKELKENQFGFPLKHYAQQYLFGATGLRIHVFNSIQGPKEAGKSTLLFDIMGDMCASKEDGGLDGLAYLYELEGKISPSILYSILRSHGESAVESCIPVQGMTLEEAMADLNTSVIKAYEKTFPRHDAPLIIGFDSIGGSSSEDTIGKLEKDGYAGKGFHEKQHIMKYFCENQGTIFARHNIPIVIICINQERDVLSGMPSMVPQKTITGGKAQLFKDGHMISASKKSLASGDGNVVYLKTTKTSFCDPRKIEVEFRWNKYGKKQDDAYEARFLWGLASARCLAEPEKGVGEIRDICDVKVSDKNLVTCPQLGLKSVEPDVFEAALMADTKMLDQLYTYQKIEKLRSLAEYAAYINHDEPEPEKPAQKPKPDKKKAGKQPAEDVLAVASEESDGES